MAPKKAKKTTPTATSSRAVKPKAGAAEAVLPAKRSKLVLSWEEEENSKKARSGATAPKGSLESKVYRCLLDNFREFTDDQVDHVIVDGVSLRARLRRDKEAWMQDPKKQRMGRPYYEMLKELYGGAEHLPNLLVADKTLPITAALFAAMALARESTPKYDKLLHFMASTPSVNQREVCGLLSFMSKLNHRRADHRSVSKEVLRGILRCKGASLYPNELAVCSNMFQTMLVQEHIACSKGGVSPDRFLSGIDGLWQLVLPEKSVETLLKLPEDAQWADHKQDLLAVVSAGSLGRQLFACALADMVAVNVSEVMENLRAELYLQSSLTTEVVAKLKKKYGDELEEIPQIETLKHPRAVTIHYRDHEMRMSVSSEYDELSLVVSAAVKSMAVESGCLLSLPAEELFCERNERLQRKKVDMALVSECHNARTQAVAVLRAKNANTGEKTMEVLQSESKNLRNLDISFDIELQWMQYLCNEGGQKKLVALADKAVTDALEEGDVKHALAALQIIKDGNIYKYSSTAAQSFIDGIAAWLAKLRDGVAPTCPANCEANLHKVWQKLPNFLTTTEFLPSHQEANDGVKKEDEEAAHAEPPKEKLHRGISAFQHLWHQLEPLTTEQTDLEALQQIVPYTAFVSPELRDAVRKRVNECMAIASKGALAKMPKTTATDSKKPKATTGEDAARAIFDM